MSFSFDHIQLNARDVEATAAFYERVFGMRRIRASEANGVPFVHLDTGGVRLSINGQAPHSAGRGNGVDHEASPGVAFLLLYCCVVRIIARRRQGEYG